MHKDFIKNFVKGSAAASLGSFLSIVFHFVSIMFLTRILPKDEFGIYILILVTVNFINILSGLGFNLTLVRAIASENKSDKETIMVTIFSLRFFTLLLSGIAFYLISKTASNLFDQRLDAFTISIIILFILSSFRDIFYNLLQGLNQFKNYAITQTISAGSRFFAILAMVSFFKLTLVHLVHIEIVTTALTVFLQAVFINFKSFDYLFPKMSDFKNTIKFSIPLFFNNIVNIIIERINIFIIGAYLNPTSIAYFDIADKIPQALKKMFLSFIVVYFPNIAKLFSLEKGADAEKFMNKSLILFSVSITFLLLLCFLFKEEIIVVLFSENYLASANSFVLLMLAFYFRAITTIVGNSLVAAGYPSVPVKANIVSSILGILSSLVMIPGYGFIGAVYSTILMNVISKLIHVLYAFKLKLYPDIKEILKPMVIFIFLSSIYFLLDSNFLLLKLFVSTLFLLAIWFLVNEVKSISKSILKFNHY